MNDIILLYTANLKCSLGQEMRRKNEKYIYSEIESEVISTYKIEKKKQKYPNAYIIYKSIQKIINYFLNNI